MACVVQGECGGNTMHTSPTDPAPPLSGSAAPTRPHDLLVLAATRMPFGKYQGRLLIDLPEPYVVWFSRVGFPKGKLGNMLRAVYEIKVNGLEYLFEPLRRGPPPA